VTPLDLVFYAPLCLAITFVWAGTREDSREKIIRHGVVLFARATVGLLLFCLGLQLVIALKAGG
jgi:hypothetical protein